jgi:hypothetical protein
MTQGNVCVNFKYELQRANMRNILTSYACSWTMEVSAIEELANIPQASGLS